MDIIYERLASLIPLGKLFEHLGWNKDLGDILSLAMVILIAWAIIEGVKSLWARYQNSVAAENLMPQFDIQSVNKARKYFIQTRFQNASPTRQEEPGFTHQYVSSSPLISFFIDKAFVDKNESERFYIILGDSGMGKSTFMINLYMQYNSFFNWKKKYKMRLLRFSHPDTTTIIKSIELGEARDTILLLDALDEDPKIVSNNPSISAALAFENRVEEIIELTRNFREVVLTCRTQYFPGQEDHPYELSVKRPDERGNYKLNKLYISPLTDSEVKIYLRKKYGLAPIWLNKKKKNATILVKKSSNLVTRPMLLDNIDLLIEKNYVFSSKYSVYDALVKGWLNREGEKRRDLQHIDLFTYNLKKVSIECAFLIYKNYKKEQRMNLTSNEVNKIALENQITLRPDEITGQSLLTCDGIGNWKFAHKSIMEFFIALGLNNDSKRFEDFTFVSMDMAMSFFDEGNQHGLRLALLGSKKKESRFVWILPIRFKGELKETDKKPFMFYYGNNLYKPYRFNYIIRNKNINIADIVAMGKHLYIPTDNLQKLEPNDELFVPEIMSDSTVMVIELEKTPTMSSKVVR